MAELYKNMCNLQEISKTIRFKLIPYGATENNLDEMLKNDKARAENYEIVKKLIDREMRKAIEESLAKSDINWIPLYKHLQIEQRDKSWDKNYEKLRKEYVKALSKEVKKSAKLKKLQGKDFVPYLLETDLNEKEKEAVKSFNKFTLYFDGFRQTRENIFSEEAISTSLYYRILDENFLIFIRNIDTINIINKMDSDIILRVENRLKEDGYLNEEEKILDDIFSINSYNNFILQAGIDFYNLVIGGYINGNEKIKGLQEEINIYNQKNRSDKLPRLNPLKKQILSEKIKKPIFDPIKNDKELLDKINCLIQTIDENGIFGVHGSVMRLCQSLNHAQKNKIYISNTGLSRLSSFEFKYYAEITSKLKKQMETDVISKKKSGKLSQKERNEINSLLGIQEEDKKAPKPQNLNMGELDKLLLDENISILSIYTELLSNLIEDAYKKYEKIKAIKNSFNVKNIKNEENIKALKEFMDAVNEVLKVLKFIDPKNQIDVDEEFYGEYFRIVEMLYENTVLLNQVRNYVTKVDYKNEKIKVNFDIPELGKGWPKSKEQTNKTLIFRDNGLYYLGIIRPGKKIDFDNIICTSEKDYLEKMEYHQFVKAYMNLPNYIFRKEVKAHFEKESKPFIINPSENSSYIKPFTITKEFYDIYNIPVNGHKKFKKDYLRNNPSDIEGWRKALNTVINGCKDFISAFETTQVYDFSSLKETDDYNDISEFYHDIEKLAYKVSFVKISKSKIIDFVDDGSLLLFQIYNKDFSKNKRGRDNLHTMYWKALFSKENLKQNTLRLAGNAEVFFRAKSIDAPVIHKKGERIVNKTYEENGVIKSIPNEVILEINNWLQTGETTELSNQAKEFYKKAEFRELEYDIIKNKRFTMDQFQFHVPIKFNAECDEENINKLIQERIKDSKDLNIIGIDRGERNLIYISVIDKDGNIIEQKSLNQINGVDYHQKLDAKEKERMGARRSWETIKAIKNVKEGYVAAAVHEIVTLAEKYNALIVMENLNVGFKRGRYGIEKQVYQKIETMLANKLSFMVNKEADINQLGGVLKAYQLAEPIDLVENVGNINGIMLYVPAGYTSKIDPITGFVNVFNFRRNKNLEDKRDFISKMNSIKYDKNKDMFVFDFNYDNFHVLQKLSKKNWQVYTNGDRVRNYKDKTGYWESEEINLTEKLKDALGNNIHIEDEKDYKKEILKSDNLVKEFYNVFKLAVQMRNSKPEGDASPRECDYIISPIVSNGKFYDSRFCTNNQPQDADANGAYNIARKGLFLVKRFYKSTDNYMNTVIKNSEWFEFVQQ